MIYSKKYFLIGAFACLFSLIFLMAYFSRDYFLFTDKNTLILSSNQDGGWDLYLYNIVKERFKKVTDKGMCLSSTWSPDRKWVAYQEENPAEAGDFHTGHIWKMAICGFKRIKLTSGNQYDSSPSWSPDGKWIAYTSRPSPNSGRYLRLMSPDGSNNTDLGCNDSFISYMFVSWFFDSKKVIFTAIGSDQISGLYYYDMEKKHCKLIIKDDRLIPYVPRCSPNSNSIIFTSRFNLYSINIQGSDLKQLTFENTDKEATWSPDGTKIVFSRVRNGLSNIWIMNLDGSDQKQITFRRNDMIIPVWGN